MNGILKEALREFFKIVLSLAWHKTTKDDSRLLPASFAAIFKMKIFCLRGNFYFRFE
jgi:hypothetical protein